LAVPPHELSLAFLLLLLQIEVIVIIQEIQYDRRVEDVGGLGVLLLGDAWGDRLLLFFVGVDRPDHQALEVGSIVLNESIRIKTLLVFELEKLFSVGLLGEGAGPGLPIFQVLKEVHVLVHQSAPIFIVRIQERPHLVVVHQRSLRKDVLWRALLMENLLFVGGAEAHGIGLGEEGLHLGLGHEVAIAHLDILVRLALLERSLGKLLGDHILLRNEVEGSLLEDFVGIELGLVFLASLLAHGEAFLLLLEEVILLLLQEHHGLALVEN